MTYLHRILSGWLGCLCTRLGSAGQAKGSENVSVTHQKRMYEGVGAATDGVVIEVKRKSYVAWDVAGDAFGKMALPADCSILS